MQLQKLQTIPNNPSIVELNYTPIQEYYLPSPPIPTGNISQTTAMFSLNEYRLVSVGTLLANMLVYTLDQLRAYNERAVYPIVSILEPYMKATEELDLRMPPLSSRRVTINVVDRGRAKPDLYIE